MTWTLLTLNLNFLDCLNMRTDRVRKNGDTLKNTVGYSRSYIQTCRPTSVNAFVHRIASVDGFAMITRVLLMPNRIVHVPGNFILWRDGSI